MSISDKLASFADSYFKITDPSKYKQRMGDRALASSLGYRAAKSNRLRSNIRFGNKSADDHTNEAELDTLRDTARDLDRNNLYAKAILDRLGEAVLGQGIDIQIQSPNKNWNKKVTKLFNEFWNDKPEIRGIFSGKEIEKLVFRAIDVDGDILINKLSNGKIQIIEGDRIRDPKRAFKNVDKGVELDKFGAVTKFHIYEHEDRIEGRDKYSSTTINAEDAIFLANRARLSQTRGVPRFAPAFDLFEDMDAFTEASVIQQKMAANHVMAVTRNDHDAIETTTEEDSEGNEREQEISAPGSVVYLESGEDVKMLGASQTGQQYSPFITQLLRFAGLPFGLPLEILSLDFSKTNYSSARASLLTAHKGFLMRHKKFVSEFMEPIIRWKVEEWIKKGILGEVKDFEVSSTPPKMIVLDPVKETKADIDRIQSGLSSNREVCNTNGTSWQSTMDYRTEEIMYAIKNSDNVVKKTGAKIDWRDILGMSKSFNPAIFQEEEIDESDNNTE